MKRRVGNRIVKESDQTKVEEIINRATNSNGDVDNIKDWERQMQIINGWRSVEECAATVWSSIHSSLLDGELVYGYRRTDEKSDLHQLVIVKNQPGSELNGYALGMVTTSFSVLYPNVPFSYLADNIVQDLKKFKVDKDIIENYLKVLEYTRKKYGEEI